MGYLTVLHWESTPSASFTYGSQISYQKDGSVIFSNTRQEPGTPIHYWQNLPLNGLHRPHDQFPLLKRGHTYAFQVAAQIEPANSVAVNISFLDENNHMISQHFVQQLNGTFTMPEDAKDYRLELLNINNQKIHFVALYLGEVDVIRSLAVDDLIPELFLHVHDYTKPDGREIIVLRRRVPTELLELGEVSDQYFFRVPAKLLTEESKLRELAVSAYQKLHLDNSKDLLWRVMTSEAEPAIRTLQEVFQNAK